MPRGDGTGPLGLGSMTGKGAGCCTGLAVTGCAGRRIRGWGQGGWNAFPAPAEHKQPLADSPASPDSAPATAIDALMTQNDSMAHTLEELSKRLDSLEGSLRENTK